MTKRYNHKAIEKKWQNFWEKKRYFAAKDFSDQKKQYVLFEFPYPSGAGLHVGHLRPYVGADVVARFQRMRGYNVLFPIGWDAFGLPTENYAIKNKIHPRVATDRNIKTFRKQMRQVGFQHSGTGTGRGHDVIVAAERIQDAGRQVSGGRAIPGIIRRLAATGLRPGHLDLAAGAFQEKAGRRIPVIELVRLVKP